MRTSMYARPTEQQQLLGLFELFFNAWIQQTLLNRKYIYLLSSLLCFLAIILTLSAGNIFSIFGVIIISVISNKIYHTFKVIDTYAIFWLMKFIAGVKVHILVKCMIFKFL